MTTYSTVLLKLVVPVVALLAITLWVADRFDTDTPLSVAVVGAAMIAFGFFLVPAGADAALSDRDLRRAITGAVIVEYALLVGIVAFFTRGPDKLPPISESLVSSFTTTVGVVVAFYFGASAYVEVQRGKARGQKPMAGAQQDAAADDRPQAGDRG